MWGFCSQHDTILWVMSVIGWSPFMLSSAVHHFISIPSSINLKRFWHPAFWPSWPWWGLWLGCCHVQPFAYCALIALYSPLHKHKQRLFLLCAWQLYGGFTELHGCTETCTWLMQWDMSDIVLGWTRDRGCERGGWHRDTGGKGPIIDTRGEFWGSDFVCVCVCSCACVHACVHMCATLQVSCGACIGLRQNTWLLQTCCSKCYIPACNEATKWTVCVWDLTSD
jgi:hypothetical protein